MDYLIHFFSFSIRQHSLERQTKFHIRAFIASVILYFFARGCASFAFWSPYPRRLGSCQRPSPRHHPRVATARIGVWVSPRLRRYLSWTSLASSLRGKH